MEDFFVAVFPLEEVFIMFLRGMICGLMNYL